MQRTAQANVLEPSIASEPPNPRAKNLWLAATLTERPAPTPTSGNFRHCGINSKGSTHLQEPNNRVRKQSSKLASKNKRKLAIEVPKSISFYNWLFSPLVLAVGIGLGYIAVPSLFLEPAQATTAAPAPSTKQDLALLRRKQMQLLEQKSQIEKQNTALKHRVEVLQSQISVAPNT